MNIIDNCYFGVVIYKACGFTRQPEVKNRWFIEQRFLTVIFHPLVTVEQISGISELNWLGGI